MWIAYTITLYIMSTVKEFQSLLLLMYDLNSIWEKSNFVNKTDLKKKQSKKKIYLDFKLNKKKSQTKQMWKNISRKEFKALRK